MFGASKPAGVQVENGPRFAMQWEYKEQKVEVATGYDVSTDRWAYHVYVVPHKGARQRLVDEVKHAASMKQAFDEGLTLAMQKLDQA